MERLRRADEDKRDAAAAKNELESYILATRSRVRAHADTRNARSRLHRADPGGRAYASNHQCSTSITANRTVQPRPEACLSQQQLLLTSTRAIVNRGRPRSKDT